MSSLSKKWDQWLSFSSPLSKTGLVLIFSAIFLSLIAVFKGIQVLVFVPAFILTLFVLSAFEIFWWKRFFSVKWEGKFLHLSWKKPLPNAFFRLAVQNHLGNWQFCTPTEKGNFRIAIPHNAQKIRFFFHGTQDIFRIFFSFAIPPHFFSTTASSEKEIFLHIRPYENGDTAATLDMRKTQKTGKWHIRKKEEIAAVRGQNENQHNGKTKGNIASHTEFSVRSSVLLLPKNVFSLGKKAEWGMIFVGAIGVFLQWANPVLLIFFVATAFFSVVFAEKLSRKWLNPFALFLFAASGAEGLLTQDSVMSGAHFLLFLATAKHLFPRERRDAFTYNFLILFVFVALSLFSIAAWFLFLFLALSLFSIAAWFLFLFLAFLVLSGVVFVAFAGGEIEEEYASVRATAFSFRHLLGFIGKIFFGTFLLFFLLPHGNIPQNTSQLLQKKENTQTGFSDQSSLNSVQSIKQNLSKAFVITNAQKKNIKMYEKWYWKGARFGHFDGVSWKKFSTITVPFAVSSNVSAENFLEIKYYLDGSKNVFFPFPPQKFVGGELQMMGMGSDIFVFQKPQFTAKTVMVEWNEENEKNAAQKNAVEKIFARQKVEKSVEKLMMPFWETVPESAQKDPEKLRDFIEKNFAYSLENPSADLNDFLYGSKQGHCEYFATVLALSLQHFGFSATMINGFFGGEWNEQADAWIVRNANAHSWVEWWDSEHWKILDATPASDTQNSAIWQALTTAYDAVEIRWNRFVVGFTGERQKAFFAWLFSFWAFFVAFSGAMVMGFLGKKIWEWRKNENQKSEEKKFVEWWTKKTGKKFFAEFFHLFPDLVDLTQKRIFSVSAETQKISVVELQKKWKKSLKNQKNNL